MPNRPRFLEYNLEGLCSAIAMTCCCFLLTAGISHQLLDGYVDVVSQGACQGDRETYCVRRVQMKNACIQAARTRTTISAEGIVLPYSADNGEISLRISRSTACIAI